MVRNYKPKTETTWTKEDMENAIDMARRTKNIKAAVRHYKIPYTTLRYHISGKVSGEHGRGHPTVLTADEEREIVEACVIFAEWGFGLGRREVEGIIQKKIPFKNGVPGEGWWSGFMKRHPELRHRKPQHLQMFRAKATNQEVINHWFIECLKPVLETLSLLNSPEQIYSVDESGFPLSWTPKTILTRKGHKNSSGTYSWFW